MSYEITRFVEDIRSTLETHCENAVGTAFTKKQVNIESWFKAREGSRVRVVSYRLSRKKRGSTKWIDSSLIHKKAAMYIKIGYPVVIDFDTARGNGHSAVATKYKEWHRNLRPLSILDDWMVVG